MITQTNSNIGLWSIKAQYSPFPCKISAQKPKSKGEELTYGVSPHLYLTYLHAWTNMHLGVSLQLLSLSFPLVSAENTHTHTSQKSIPNLSKS